MLLAGANLLAHPGCYALGFAEAKNVDCGSNSALKITDTFITSEAGDFPTAFSANQWEKVAVNELAEASHGYSLRCGGNAIVDICFSIKFTPGKSIHQAMDNFN